MDPLMEKEANALYAELQAAAESGGYHLNPQLEDTKELVKALLVNEKRYGYQACPCREASGNKAEDLDIICPCDYRDPDLHDFDACFCGLYVSQAVLSGVKQVKPIPERRAVRQMQTNGREEHIPGKQERLPETDAGHKLQAPGKLKYPVWRCKVCGYLCAREHPPETCPVCKAKKERFEVFL